MYFSFRKKSTPEYGIKLSDFVNIEDKRNRLFARLPADRPADEVVLFISYMAVTSQQPIPCYPAAAGSSPPL